MGEHSHGFPHRYRAARRTVAVALAITVVMGFVELAGGVLSNSLALQGDAAHMFVDTAALSIALAGLALAARPPASRKTFGYHRAEVLGALLNGLLLVAIAGYVVWRAFGRFLNPEPVQGPLMLLIAVVGLIANGAALVLLRRQRSDSIGARGAFLHVLSDAATSVAAIFAGVLVWRYSLFVADPIISLVIVAFIVRGALGLLRESGDILMEAASRSVDQAEIGRLLRAEPGVRAVHDIHVWSLSAGVVALTAHIEVTEMPLAEAMALKDRLKERLRRVAIEHVVLELDLDPSIRRVDRSGPSSAP